MPVDATYLRTIEHWRVRFESVGVPGSSIDSVVTNLDDWSDWPQLWKQLGDKEVAYAVDQEERGHDITASAGWYRAGLYYHYGLFVLFDNEPVRSQLVDAKLAAFSNAFRGMHPGVEQVTLESAAGVLHANVRRPDTSEPPPVVIILPGADSSKEEYVGFEDLLLDRGLATISVDGPGQGETRHRGVGWRFDYETAFPAVIDFVRSSDELRTDGIGLIGFSFGGYLAPRVAALCPEIIATVSLGGCFDLSGWDDLPPLLKADLMYLFEIPDEEEVRRRATDEVTLRDSLPGVRGDLLAVHSTADRIFSHQNARAMKELKPTTEVVIYEGGDHCCHNRSHHAKPMMADWLADHLG
ncbi:MAG: alpha/beta hydrolase [Acidimicrobiia bacterium]|nr:alpha/beta hydrolase [Acidimicrobiia bacterium]